jgi:hypothetical protein
LTDSSPDPFASSRNPLNSPASRIVHAHVNARTFAEIPYQSGSSIYASAVWYYARHAGTLGVAG